MSFSAKMLKIVNDLLEDKQPSFSFSATCIVP